MVLHGAVSRLTRQKQAKGRKLRLCLPKITHPCRLVLVLQDAPFSSVEINGKFCLSVVWTASSGVLVRITLNTGAKLAQ